MKRALLITIFLFASILSYAQIPVLKSIVYDFDGLDIGQTDLPDGDYKNFDLIYQVAANPLSSSDVLGDRVLKLDLNWTSGKGTFGKGISRYIELNVAADHFNFYCYNPLSNYASATVDIAIQEDDNSNNNYDNASDDQWSNTISIPRSSGWQLISVPLNLFVDVNAGGNGIFDMGYTGNAGKVFTVSLTFKKATTTVNPESYFIDMLCFSEGTLPTGNTTLDLPPKNISDHCLLGCLAYKSPADSVPVEVEGLFPSGNNKLKYVNIFVPYAHSGTIPSAFPGTSVQVLLNNGYTPMITWEMIFSSYAPLDPVQPRLAQILAGDFDSYFDSFADKIIAYNDTILIRLFHEFDGDWYPWSIALNNQDPNQLINAFRYIVDHFRARGAAKVKWIWSPNSLPNPSLAFNWAVNAYPGDNYVDMVATSIYNHPFPGSPPWRSFRSLLSETYYYLTEYFPDKPFFICEVACRERYNAEVVSSQIKAEWMCQMNKDLQSYFSKTRALIFFSKIKEHDWRINSSFAAQEAVRTCIWEDSHYSEEALSVSFPENPDQYRIYPNPFTNEITIALETMPGLKAEGSLKVYDIMGKKVGSYIINDKITFGNELPRGIYLLDLTNESNSKKIKVVKR